MKTARNLFILLVLFAGCGQQKQADQEITEKQETKARSTEFQKIDPKQIPGNVIEMIADEWMLITAGNETSYNTMTAGWGAMGNLWNKPMASCFINPDRYTFEFVEQNDYYTLSFFDKEYIQALVYCGSNSGRDQQDKNKAEAAGLTPAYTENGSVYFKEAYLVLECKKLYSDQFEKENFATDVIMTSRNGETSKFNDQEKMHKFYFGEIVNCWMREELNKNENTMETATLKQDFLSIIYGRKSVRSFVQDKKISDQDIRKIVKAGMSAPSGMNKRPWEIVVIDDRATLDALAEKLPYAKMLKQAPQAMVVCGRPEQSAYWYVDCSAVAENILLAVEALNLGAVWTATYPYEDRMDAVKEHVGLPDDVLSLCIIPMGYPEGNHQAKDKYDETKLHFNKW